MTATLLQGEPGRKVKGLQNAAGSSKQQLCFKNMTKRQRMLEMDLQTFLLLFSYFFVPKLPQASAYYYSNRVITLCARQAVI